MYGSTVGIGDDNPSDPYTLTTLQAARSVMVMFEDTATFQVRLTVSLKRARGSSVT